MSQVGMVVLMIVAVGGVAAATALARTSGNVVAFAKTAGYRVCFTPGGDCEQVVIDAIHQARSSILVQAYEFTSAPIAGALADARRRGIDVRVILDKSQRSEQYSVATFFKNERIPTVIDERPAVAHNKVLILDGTAVLTGSFNFTTSAQRRNAENLIVIQGDPTLAGSYTSNWMSRWQESVPY